MHDEIRQQITDLYQDLYTAKLRELNQARELDSNEQKAQKYAIKEAALRLFNEHTEIDKYLLWAEIYRSHVARKSGVDIPPESINKVISADQSWKKSSGHAFEEMVKELCNIALESTGIKILLQRDVSIMINAGTIRNEAPDILYLTATLNASVFDLYAEKDGFIFGCIQAKTSIRDRVTRDREPSLAAMNNYFWSIIFALDGSFLRLPKFMSMVRGGSEEFVQNGWHGLYAFSLPSSVDCERIYKLDADLENFKLHAEKAHEEWNSRRQWFTNEWIADNP